MAAAAAVRSCVLQQVIATLGVCTALLVCVEADYRLEVQFIRWNNPTGMCGDPRCAAIANEGCCDPLNTDRQGRPDRCLNVCGYHPRFCVRPLGTESNSTSDCLERVTFTGFSINDDDVTFGTGSAAFIGTPNPAVFTGRRWPGGIQLFMEVYDADNGLDVELVDRFAVDASVSVGSNITTTNTGVFGLMELTVNFRVMCVERSFVLDCITCFGVNRDPSTNCSGCLAGYGGSNCDVDLDPCGHTTPCENGATCNNTGPDQYECLCAAGFEGDSCERETNECDPNPCMNGGSCTDLLAGYNCSCAAGFEGDSCERETNECDPNPCMNGGSCTDLLAGYNCSCQGGFNGTNCEQEEGSNRGDNSNVAVVPGIVGGVVGGLLVTIIVILMVAVVVMATVLCGKKEKALTSTTETKTAASVMSTDNPTYTPGEVGSHVPPHKSQTNTGSSAEHDFDNPLYDVEKGPTNEYSAPWGVHSHTPTSKPPVKAVEDNKPHQYDYTVKEGAAPTAVYDYAETPATQTQPEKMQLPMYDYADNPTRLPPNVDPVPNVDGQQPTYDYAETPATQSKLEKEQLPMYDYADSPATKGVLPQHMYDYAESSTVHPSGSPQLVYDYAESPVAHVNTNGGFPIHEYDYAATKQPIYTNREPGTPPPGVGEHYEMMPTENGAAPTDHYEFGPN